MDRDDSLYYANWHNLDPDIDKIYGIGTEKAYRDILNDKLPKKTIIVAVIDNGIDINHEDFKNQIWINKDEIPGNGIDDDNNGYIDDINGWNFLGNSKGEYINYANLEVTRLYKKFKPTLDSFDIDELINSDTIDHKLYLKVKNNYESETKELKRLTKKYKKLLDKFNVYDSILTSLLDNEDYSVNDVKELKTKRNTLADSARKFMITINKKGYSEETLRENNEYLKKKANYHYNLEFSSRHIIGDSVTVWDSVVYGNNDLFAYKPDHGTMVAGIIAANRNNNIGINGIVDSVKIMGIRAVPDGDEWDKDVAKAILYAIENGADIINMSFGKEFSPQKSFIDSIVRLIDKNDVLIVHAAGNDNENIDIMDHFPKKFSLNNELLVNNWITVGASSIKTKKKIFIAPFSNYGKESVDIFAPGYNMISCNTGNTYDLVSGTSFAAPMVSGAAALIKSYYPELSAAQIKEILLKSGKFKNIKVLLPGTKGKRKKYVKFSSLSASGGLLNVYKALKLAEELTLQQ